LNGATITEKTFTFTTKHIPFNKLSKDQQAEILRNQDNFTYGVSAINYVNFGELLANGLPSAQLAAIKQSLFDYSEVIKKQYWKMTLVEGSVSTAPHNPASADTNSTVYFTVSLAGANYNVQATYDTLRDDLYQLVITDQAGNTVYDTLAASD
jgi:hypothetical protein